MSAANLTDRGFQFDRRWMLVDECNHFLTQRDYPKMCLLQTAIQNNQLVVYPKFNEQDQINLDLHPLSSDTCRVKVWEDECEAVFLNQKVDKWFSEKLSVTCRLVFMPDTEKRPVDLLYASQDHLNSFSDGFPLLMIGQASLDELNRRLEQPLSWDRFRPNIVFTGGRAHDEDTMEHIRINSTDFFGVKWCSRCMITTIDQSNAAITNEPIQTLLGYRKNNNHIYFGQNLLGQSGFVEVGNEIEIIKRKNPFTHQ